MKKFIKLAVPLAFIPILVGCSQSTPTTQATASQCHASPMPSADEMHLVDLMRKAVDTGVISDELRKTTGDSDLSTIKTTLTLFDLRCS